MRELQYVGILIGLLIIGYAFWKRKQGRYSRQQFFIASIFSCGLLIIATFPSAGDLIATPLQMDRWNAVLFVTNIALLLLLLFVMNQSNANSRTISRLIKALATQNFLEDKFQDSSSELIVVIPAYNEEDNIGDVLRRMPKHVHGLKITTLVAVDGATDRTADVARMMDAAVVVNPINRGGGAALRAGYEIALQKNAEIVVTLDADGQHLPEEISVIVEPIITGQADFVNGSRVLGSHEAESQIRSVGIGVFNRLITILMGQRITDASNAFRAIRVDTLRELTLYQDQFHTSEILIEALKKGARVVEVPITILKRQSGETKKPPSLRYGWGFMKAIVGTWLR